MQDSGRRSRKDTKMACRLVKNLVGVEKVRDRISFLFVMVAAAEFLLSSQLRGGFHSGCYRLAEEPH